MRSNLAIYDDIKNLSCTTEMFDWIRWDGSPDIRKHFSDADWTNIVVDVPDDAELLRSCQKGFIAVYLLFDKIRNTFVGFVFVIVDDPVLGYVSIHGGAWDYGSNYLLADAYIQMNERLLLGGWKAHTSCGIKNKRAYRFSKRLGFVVYAHDDVRYYKYVTLKRLQSTPFYKRYKERMI